MLSRTSSDCAPMVPALVRAVLVQSAKWLAAGHIDHHTFSQQISRLTREELGPRHLSLMVRLSAGGNITFSINDRQNRLCELIECAELLEATPEAEAMLHAIAN